MQFMDIPKAHKCDLSVSKDEVTMLSALYDHIVVSVWFWTLLL